MTTDYHLSNRSGGTFALADDIAVLLYNVRSSFPFPSAPQSSSFPGRRSRGSTPTPST